MKALGSYENGLIKFAVSFALALVTFIALAVGFANAQSYPDKSQCPNGAHEVCTPAYYDANGNLVPSHCYWVCN